MNIQVNFLIWMYLSLIQELVLRLTQSLIVKELSFSVYNPKVSDYRVITFCFFQFPSHVSLYHNLSKNQKARDICRVACDVKRRWIPCSPM